MRGWGIFAGIAAAAVLVLVLAPTEQTLGQGIKMVYLHVALTWAGMAGFAVAGLLGAAVLVTARIGAEGKPEWLASGMLALGRAALGVYAAGFVVSMAAQQINWGGLFWSEPRTIGALQVLGVALIVQVAIAWVPWMWARGLLSAALAVFVFWLGRGESILHPENAIGGTSSGGIRGTFLVMFALCSLGMVWAVWHWLAGRPRVQHMVEQHPGGDMHI